MEVEKKGKFKFSLSNLSLPAKAGLGTLGAIVVLTAGLSIYKQHHKPQVAVYEHGTYTQRPQPRQQPKPQQKVETKKETKKQQRLQVQQQAQPQVQSAQAKEKTTKAKTVAKNKSLTVDEVLKQVAVLERKLYLLKEENKYLQEKIKNLEAKEKLNQLKPQEPITIEPPKEVETLKLQIEALKNQLAELKKKKVSSEKAENLKEALNKMFSKLKQPQFPQVPKERYQLVAVVNDKAILKDSKGNRIEVKNGDELNGRVVKVSKTTVKIGDEVLSIFDGLSQGSSSFLSSSFPPPSLR